MEHKKGKSEKRCERRNIKKGKSQKGSERWNIKKERG